MYHYEYQKETILGKRRVKEAEWREILPLYAFKRIKCTYLHCTTMWLLHRSSSYCKTGGAKGAVLLFANPQSALPPPLCFLLYTSATVIYNYKLTVYIHRGCDKLREMKWSLSFSNSIQQSVPHDLLRNQNDLMLSKQITISSNKCHLILPES